MNNITNEQERHKTIPLGNDSEFEKLIADARSDKMPQIRDFRTEVEYEKAFLAWQEDFNKQRAQRAESNYQERRIKRLMLPEISNAKHLIEHNLALPDVVIDGLLHKGSKMVLGGCSKSYKTFSLIDMAISVACGLPWWGMNTKQGKVLYLNFEIQEPFFAKRLNEISTAKGTSIDALENIHVWNLRGHSADLSLISESLEKSNNDYALIVIDPIYKCMAGKDENSAGDIGTILNQIERLAVRSGAAVVFGHHYSKGNQAAKASMDRISGSGVFARDPDTILMITQHETEGVYTVEATLRNFKPLKPFCVRWTYPLMQVELGADPTQLKSVAKKKPVHTAQQVLEILADNKYTSGEWSTAVINATGMGSRTFRDKLAELRDTKLVEQIDSGKWQAVRQPAKSSA